MNSTKIKYIGHSAFILKQAATGYSWTLLFQTILLQNSIIKKKS